MKITVIWSSKPGMVFLVQYLMVIGIDFEVKHSPECWYLTTTNMGYKHLEESIKTLRVKHQIMEFPEITSL